MESPIYLIKHLIQESAQFTFENFCYRHEDEAEFGGEDTPEWLAWKTRSYNLVRQLIAEDSSAALLVAEATKIGTSGNYSDNFDRAKSTFLKALEITLDALTEDTFGELHSSKSRGESPSLSNKIFVVHGHDHALKTDIETFIHEIGLEPIVLHRQPDQGQTIIEKFEQHSDVGFAFILLTPDEVAYTVDQEQVPEADRVKEKRARPNVIFEFGYFVGKLGRNRVCCIYKEGVVLPSDLDGLIYKKVSDSVEAQSFSIIKELQAAGYKIRME